MLHHWRTDRRTLNACKLFSNFLCFTVFLLMGHPPSFNSAVLVCQIVTWDVLLAGKQAAWRDSGGHWRQHRHKWFSSLWTWELFISIWCAWCSFGRYGRQFCIRICYTSSATCSEGEPPQVDGQFATSHPHSCTDICVSSEVSFVCYTVNRSANSFQN
jgi:hypothetical protein